jgi:hypothetical protein
MHPGSLTAALVLAMASPLQADAQPGQVRTIGNSIPPPPHCLRTEAPQGSFGAYLRDLPLKPAGSPVKLFDGRTKANTVHQEVVALPIGCRDLHQCADAVIRLRADYLYQSGKRSSISFNFTNGFRADYARWRQGWRIRAKGNKAWWTRSSVPSDSPDIFWQYLEMVFRYAGTLSLSRELVPVKNGGLEPGDVFIQGGSPGHAAIVVDISRDSTNGEVFFLLAQSYMPAQEIHVLKNEIQPEISPWYRLRSSGKMVTPEWVFDFSDLKRFPE